MSQSSVRHIDDLGQGKLIPGVHQQPEVGQHDTENLSLIYENQNKMKINKKQNILKEQNFEYQHPRINLLEETLTLLFPVKLISRF